jgi:hypothetical protein
MHQARYRGITLIVEAIADVRDSLLDNSDGGDPEAMDDGEESFHSAKSDIDRPMPATSKSQAKELSPEEEEERVRREIAVHAKCLHIARCTLENVHGDIEPNAKLMSLVDNLIIPAVQSHDNPIRERGVICLGLATLLSKVCRFSGCIITRLALIMNRNSLWGTWICFSMFSRKVMIISRRSPFRH